MRYLFCLLISFSILFSDENIVVFGNNYKPPKIWTQDTIDQGILVEVMYEVQKELGIKFEVQTHPWARAFKLASFNQGGIVGISYTKQRAKKFDFNSVPLFLDTIILVVKKGKEFSFENITDLKDKKVGYCRGCSFGKVFEEAKKYFIPIETDDSREQRLKMLLNDKIDVALIGPGNIGFFTVCDETNQFEDGDFTVLKKPLVVDPNYIAFEKSMKKKELLEKFDKILQKKIDDGTVDKIITEVLKRETK